MDTSNFTPNLNLPNRRQKGLTKIFTGNAGSGIPCPFYYTTDVVREGQPMKFGTAQDLVLACEQGDGAKAMGLVMQQTYNETNWDPELRGFYLAGNTKQRLDGQPIGVLMGSGFAQTTNYVGTVAFGTRAYIAASGYLAPSGTNGADADDKLPVVFEGAGTDGDTEVRIRFDFPVVG